MRRIIMLGGKCDMCPTGSIKLQVVPLYHSWRVWGCVAVALLVGYGIGVLQ